MSLMVCSSARTKMIFLTVKTTCSCCQVGATSAIKNSAAVAESFADEPMETLTDVGGSK